LLGKTLPQKASLSIDLKFITRMWKTNPFWFDHF
jgi:hypothetical protein